MPDSPDRARRGRAARLEHAVGHLSPADAEAEAAEFDRGLRAVTTFLSTRGEADVPDGFTDESGFPLAVWVAAQREAYLERRLGDRRRAALERVPGWAWQPGRRDHGRAEGWQA